ncbi:MAG: LGFP repeat-containing protein [Corynebacterium variabile]|uniref:LGFP repeat-containing protein n=1 Tax=Corynebacterium variabile TaxID=1727 RepID=UPI003F929438
MRHKVLRPLLAVVLALGLSSTLSPTSAAQPTITTEPTAATAAGRENLEPAEPGFDDNTIDNDAGADWHATTDPEATITPGQMRSDTEDIPGGFTKEEADRAEVQEAAEQQAQQDRATNPLARALAAEPVNCTTYWPSPYKVCGAIREKYDAIGGPTSFLTWPKSDELGVPDGVGRRNEFVNGFIYWHPTTGAHPVTTHFSTVWARNGWETGRLGYPTTDEFGLSDGIGRKQSFQRGHIYGSLAGLASIEGLIYDKWVTTGAEGGPLGYPTADEAGTPDGVGRFNRFTGGMIY